MRIADRAFAEKISRASEPETEVSVKCRYDGEIRASTNAIEGSPKMVVCAVVKAPCFGSDADTSVGIL